MKNIVLITSRDKNDINYDGVEIEKINYYDKKTQDFLKEKKFEEKIRKYLNDDSIFSSHVNLSEEYKHDFHILTNNKKLQYFIRYPERFDSDFCEKIITENKDLQRLFDAQTFLHIKNSNIYYYDCIDLDDKEYWKEIKRLLDMIKIIDITSQPNEYTEVHLVLHIGDNYLLNIIDASFFYKDDFDNFLNWKEDYEENAKRWKEEVIEKLNYYKVKTITAFHHSDTNKIYTDIIKNKEFWKDCNIDKTDFLTNAIKDCYDKDDFKDSIFNINGNYYHITNGKEEKNPKIEKMPKIEEDAKSNDYITLYATEHCFKLVDFYIALADFQLQGCNIGKYEYFIKKKNLINNLYHNDIDAPRGLSPKFDKEDFSKNIKPIIIYSKKPLLDLKKGYDRRINYLDSSIWLQYVSNQKEFDIAKCNIKIWEDLYKTTKAQEVAELRARQLKNSFIREVNENASHSNNVAPFIFHSESEMRKNLIANKLVNEETEEIEFVKLNKIKNLQWRFLIVDDHASIQVIKDKSSVIPKCKIIYNVLSKYCNIECHGCKYGKDNTDKEDVKKCCEECYSNNSHKEDKKVTIIIDCAVKMNLAIDKLVKTKYDLILIDYLLDKEDDEKQKIKEVLKKRYYAYDFLEEIKIKCESKEWTTENNQIGPNGKFQMFYISAFTNAVSERMLERGLNYDSEYWHISHGACPTTTPYLFLFYLLKRMNTQIESFTKLSKKENLKDQLEDVTTLLDLLLIIYKGKPRERAIEHFNSLLKLRLNYDNLKYDVCDAKTRCKEKLQSKNTSLLISSLFPDIPYYDSAFWEHTMHLVYLTAFGTIRQWHDMWEEFMLIKPCLQKIYDENANYGLTAKDVVTAIEKYIISLQNQSR